MIIRRGIFGTCVYFAAGNPGSLFYVILLADGGNYCACVNAATLALIDAGIPLRDYVTACTASLVEDKPLVDISSLESTQGGPELTVVSRHKFIDYCKVKL